MFGNLKTAKEVKDAMRRVLDDDDYGKADGYAPSVGTESARSAIANRYSKRFSVNYNPKVPIVLIYFIYMCGI